jgi:hypothetical protein
MLDHGAQLTLDANLCDHAVDGFSSDSGDTLWLEGEEETPARLTPWTVRWSLTR